MELTWLGTAGFIAKTKNAEIAFDPFLSRGASTPSPFTPKSFQNTRAIFVGHGHFDHAFDIPQIAANSDLQVFAPGLTGQILKLRGLRHSQLNATQTREILYEPLRVRAFHSAHVAFDLSLVLSTAKRCGVKGCLHIAKLGMTCPKGLVQSYMFEEHGKKFLFISSAGCTESELAVYRRLEIDFLLSPLQGHSQIQDIAAEQVLKINPKVVIPHHFDDFYPPMSQNISVDVFRERLSAGGFTGDVLEIPIFQSAQL